MHADLLLQGYRDDMKTNIICAHGLFTASQPSPYRAAPEQPKAI